jgi:TP901 family phage tail tape measure protein
MSSKGASFVLRLIDMVTGPLSKITDKAGSVINKFAGIGDKLSQLGKHALFLTALNTAITGTSDALNTAIAPGEKFEVQMADLHAITGVAGKALDEIGQKARDTAKQFGGSAADQVEAYKIILSKLGPDIAKSPEALDNMGKSVALLSKTMRGDAVGAVDALTTAVNQYNVDLTDPIIASQSMSRMMDIMTASAQVGAAEVPDIAAALKVAGLAAKNAGLSFEETNAAIQILAKGSVVGAEGGTALRNVMALMSRGDFMPKGAAEAVQAMGVDLNRLSDTTIPFSDRLKELQKIQGDSALVGKVFGMENKNAAMLLMQNIPLLEQWTGEVGKSGTTMEMASVIMNTHAEKMNRIGAAFKDFGIDVFNSTKEFLPFIQTSMMALAFSAQMAPAFALISGSLAGLTTRLGIATVATFGFVKGLALTGVNALLTAGRLVMAGLAAIGSYVVGIVASTAATIGLNIAMYANPIGLIVLGILAVAAAVAGAVALIITYWDEIKVYMFEAFMFLVKLNPFYWIVEMIEYVFPGFKDAVIETFSSIWDWVKQFWENIVGIWNKVMNTFGGDIVELDMSVGKEITYATTNQTASDGLGAINSADKKKETNVEGDNSRSRIVNLRIDKIEVMNKISGDVGDGLRNLEEKVANIIVGACRDAEIILSNG